MTKRTKHPVSLAAAGAGSAAYRAALGKIAPGEAFLARTRQAMAAAADRGGPRAGAARRGLRGGFGRGPVWRGGGRLPRLLLPAACCLLVLLAAPAAGLLRGGGGLSSGAPAASEQYSLSGAAQAAEDTDGAPPEVAPEDAPAAAAQEPGAPALSGKKEGAAERKQDDGVGCDSAPSEEGGAAGGTPDAPAGDAPFGGVGGTSEGFTPGEGDAPAAALTAFAAGEGWREGRQGGYDPAGLTLLRWERGSAQLGGEAPEPVVRLWVAGPDGKEFAVDLPEE